MIARFKIAPEAVWIDGPDAGKDLAIAWVCLPSKGELIELRDSAWMVWVALADGNTTSETIFLACDGDPSLSFEMVGEIETLLNVLTEKGYLIRSLAEDIEPKSNFFAP